MHWWFAKQSERNTCRLITARGGTAIYRFPIPIQQPWSEGRVRVERASISW